MHLFPSVPTQQASAQTPMDRDRIVDAARAISLLLVVAGHAVMGVVWWQHDSIKLGNLLAAFPWTQLVTWLLQISPLFFFAGGAANAISWDKHVKRNGTYANWMWLRTQRLLRPLWAYLIFAGFLAGFFTSFTDSKVTAPLMSLSTQLIWFLGCYLFVTALAPLFIQATPWRGALMTFGLIAASGLVDGVWLFASWPKAVALLNFVLVWSVPAYLGSLRARGTLARYSRKLLWSVVIMDLIINALLIKFGPWPLSLVGMPGEPISNMAPPTIVLALHSLTLVCLVTLFNVPLTRTLARPKVWRRITGINLVAMTLYLWHLPVLAVLFTASHFLGWERSTKLGNSGYPIPNGWGYLLGSLGFWAAFAFMVWAIVRFLWPLEHGALPWWDSAPQSKPPEKRAANILVGVGSAGAGIAMLILSATGLDGFPAKVAHYAGIPMNSAAAIAFLVGSGALIRWSGAVRSN